MTRMNLFVRACALCTIAAGAAMANSYSYGDAAAVLQAFTNGGWAILLHHGPTASGAPADALPPHPVFDPATGTTVRVGQVAIRPFGAWNDSHYCTTDAHTFVLALIDGGDSTFTQPQAKADLAGEEVHIFLDGTEVDVVQTALKRFLNPARFNLSVAYSYQFGHIAAAGDVTQGQHEFRLVVQNPATGVEFDNSILVTFDGPGSVACAH